jgi:acetyl esterase/lipase
VRYQAALRPDILCCPDFRPLLEFVILFGLPKSSQKPSDRGKTVTKPHQFKMGTRQCNPGQIAAASPVTYVEAKDPPMLLIGGTVPCHQTLEMAERLKAAGVPHELMVIPGVDHVFIGKTPEETREANLKALDATFRFIDRTMNNVH